MLARWKGRASRRLIAGRLEESRYIDRYKDKLKS
jgi:hypothetical protein